MAKSIQSRFMQLIFESEIAEALDLLHSSLDKQHGFEQVVDCVAAWQDLIDSSDSALRPLLECVDDDDPAVVLGALKVVNAIIQNAPDNSRAFRIQNELSELHYVNKLERLRFGAQSDVLKEIDRFQRLLRSESEDDTSERDIYYEDAAVMTSPDLPWPLFSNLYTLLLDDRACKERKLVLEKFVDILQEIRSEEDAEVVLEALRTRKIGEENGFSSTSTVCATTQVSLNFLPAVKPPPAPPLSDPGSNLQHVAVGNCVAPPPPPPAETKGAISPSPPDPGPPPPPPLAPALISTSNENASDLPVSMKPRKLPSKNLKMKTIMWSKISPTSVVHGQGSQSVWGELARESTALSLDFDMIDGMFSLVPAQESIVQSVPSLMLLARDDQLEPVARECLKIVQGASSPHIVVSFSHTSKKKCLAVDLLTPKRSQNVAIVLKQFKDLDMIISDLSANKITRFDVDLLRTLKTILPEYEEVDALRRYGGEVTALTPACSFFYRLIDIPDYRLRIECMLLRLEFHRIMEEVVPSVHLLKEACAELRESNALRRLLLLLVNIGNYLNSSSSHGNAAGFKMSSLWKIIDHRSTKGTFSLLHLVAKLDPALLRGLESDLHNINKASEISVEEIKTSLKSLGEQCNYLEEQLKVMGGSEFVEIRDYLTEYCRIELSETKKSLDEFLLMQNNLAVFFCEDKSSFKIEECLKIFKIIIVRLRQALQENEEREERKSRMKYTGKKVNGDIEALKKDINLGEEAAFLVTLETGQNHNRRQRAKEISRERDVRRSVRVRRSRDKAPTTIVKESRERQNDLNQEESSKDSETKNHRYETAVLQAEASDSKDYVGFPPKNSSLHSLKKPETAVVVVETQVTCAVTTTDQTENEELRSMGDSSHTLDAPMKKISGGSIEYSKGKENSQVTSTTTLRNKPTVPSRALQPKRMPTPSDKTNSTSSAQPRTIISMPYASLQRVAQPKTGLERTSTTTTSRPHLTPAFARRQGNAVQQPQAYTTSKIKSPVYVLSARRGTNFETTRKSGNLSGRADIESVKSESQMAYQSTITRSFSTPSAATNERQKSVVKRSNQGLPKRKETVQEHRDVPLKPHVSTSSRPSLIKTGSVPQKQNLPKLDETEIPKPLKKTTDSLTSDTPSTTKSRPKWI